MAHSYAATPSTSVLVIGGSVVGLSTAVFLAHHGVDVVVIERHRGSSPHPRAIGYTTRTIELFHQVGIELPESIFHGPPRRARVETLAGQWFEEYPWTPPSAEATPSTDVSPADPSAVAQDVLEPILRRRAVELGVDLRQGTELVEFDEGDDGVTALVRTREDGQEYRVDARYLIAADGADSRVREALGIARSGRGLLSIQRSVLFRADLEPYLRGGVVQFEVRQHDLDAFLTTYGDGRWVLMLSDDVDRSEDEQRAIIRRAIGIDELPVELLTTGRWELRAAIADQFSSGRIFLAGDAAHQLPPNRGGYGANTGIADGHNLAWKLAAVLAGDSEPALLDTYDAERRPVAQLRHDQIFARADYKAYTVTDGSEDAVIDDVAMELGQLYRSACLPAVDADLPSAMRPDQWNGRPGTRAPHLWVDPSHERSLLDEFGSRWTLVTTSAAWRRAADVVSETTGLPLSVVCLDTGEHPHFAAAYGLGPGGASLVRPDGIVAWRSAAAPTSRADALTAAVRACAMVMDRPSSRSGQLDDRDALVDLTNRYADAVNHGWNGKVVAPQMIERLFTADATHQMSGSTPTRGATTIAEVMPIATAPLPFAMHAFLNPILSVEGDEASGQWLMWVAADGEGGPRAAYLGADLTYRRTDGGWRIQSITVHVGLRIPAA